MKMVERMMQKYFLETNLTRTHTHTHPFTYYQISGIKRKEKGKLPKRNVCENALCKYSKLFIQNCAKRKRAKIEEKPKNEYNPENSGNLRQKERFKLITTTTKKNDKNCRTRITKKNKKENEV